MKKIHFKKCKITASKIRCAVFTLALSTLWLLLYLMFGLVAVWALPREWRSLANLLMLIPTACALLCKYGVGVEDKSNFITLKTRLTFLIESLGMRKVDRMVPILALIAGVAMNLMMSSVLEILPLTEEFLDSYVQAAEPLTSTYWVSITNTVVFTPLLEETVFRGLILQTLERGTGAVTSLIVSTAVFALLHGHPLWIAYAAVCGLILGGTYLMFRSTLPSIMMHLGFNAANFIWVLLPLPKAGGGSAGVNVIAVAYIAVGAVTMAVCAIAGAKRR